jgi:hypothetical protein
MHDRLDKPLDIFHKKTGGPETVEKFLLPSSGSVMKIVLQNIDLPPPIDLYTVTFNLDEEGLYNEYDPDWLKTLKNSVK